MKKKNIPFGFDITVGKKRIVSIPDYGSSSSINGFRFDYSVWLLVFSNIVTIILAITQKWGFMNILWIYWSQSVIIGFFNFLKILTLKNFSTERLLVNGKPVNPTQTTKVSTAFFFLFHYGFFHAAYLVFLIVMTLGKSAEFSFGAIMLTTLIFFGNHLYSFLSNREKDSKKKKSLGSMIGFPYLRIIPMHLTIIFGFVLPSFLPMIFFMILKTIADVFMHLIEHREEAN